MSIELVVRDGNPWWESPDIWVVPGPDPSGPPGIPVVGQTAYIWAEVGNQGDQDATAVKVDFWIADPSAQIRRSTALHLGTAYADILAGEIQDVLCLVPWHVQLINGGHECVVVEASHPDDPLQPHPVDPDVLDAATYRQIGQHNLTVLVALQKSMQVLVSVVAGRRTEKQVQISADVGGELSEHLLSRLALRLERPAREGAIRVLLAEVQGGEVGQFTDGTLEMTVSPGHSAGVLVAVEVGKLGGDEYAVVRMTQRSAEGSVEGGVSFVVVSAAHGGRDAE